MTVNRHPSTGSAVTVKQWRYTATGGETTLTGTDGFSQSLAYTVGAEEVYVNGVLLERAVDYTATTGTSVVLTNALVAGDIATVMSANAFNVANAIPNSTVTAKGDLIVGNGAASVTNLGVGADGSTLVANSSASTGVSWAGAKTQNVILNSSFDIWQRGTSIATASAYVADRWYGYRTGGNVTFSQQTGSNQFRYACRVQRTAGDTATNTMYMYQSLEIADATPYAGQTVTLSFYARAGANYSATSNGLTVKLVTGTGTTETNRMLVLYTGDTTLISSGVTLTTSLVRYQVTATMGASVTQFCIGFETNPTGAAGAADYFDVTGVQIDLGSVALPYRRYSSTLQGELNACERYYERSTPGVAYGKYGQAYYNNSSSQVVCNVEFKTTKRVIPTSIDYANLRIQQNGIGALGTISAVSINIESTTKLADLTVTIGSGATNTLNPIELMNDNNTAGYLGFSAEL